ncbi:MAG TPA: helix-turn-helix domain-containing protein [Novosphingobium sp.]
MIRIAALVLPGTFAASLAPLTDAYLLMQERRARTVGSSAREAPDVQLSLLSTDGRPVTLDRLAVRIDTAIDGPEHYDFVWLPAFMAGGEEPLRERLAANGETIRWLRDIAAGGALIGASGAAVTLLLAAGLTGKQAVPVAPPLLAVVRTLFPRFHHGPDLALADHRNLLLSRGIAQDTRAIAAAFARIFSPETGRWIRSVFGIDCGQDGSGPEPEARDPLVARAQLILEQRFATSVSMAELAAELHVSHAVLIRRFRRAVGLTPSGYVQQLRIRAAERMLRHSDRSIDSIAAAIGFSDARLFRQMFRKVNGLSATAWRQAQRASG